MPALRDALLAWLPTLGEDSILDAIHKTALAIEPQALASRLQRYEYLREVLRMKRRGEWLDDPSS